MTKIIIIYYTEENAHSFLPLLRRRSWRFARWIMPRKWALRSKYRGRNRGLRSLPTKVWEWCNRAPTGRMSKSVYFLNYQTVFVCRKGTRGPREDRTGLSVNRARARWRPSKARFRKWRLRRKGQILLWKFLSIKAKRTVGAQIFWFAWNRKVH